MLTEALECVERQEVQDLEVLVVDNGKERVPSSLKQKFKHVRFLDLPQRSGVSVARNFGAMHATGKYIAFLDDDDLWSDDYLSSMWDYIEKEQADLVAAPIRVVGAGDESIKQPVEPTEIGKVPAWRQIGYIGSNIVLKREAFQEVGGFPARLITGEDRALVINFILARKKVSVCQSTSCIKREHEDEQLTDNKTLMLGKLGFLTEYGSRMSRQEMKEDRFAFLVYLSREWGWPVWLAGCIAMPSVFIHRVLRKLPGNTKKAG